MKAFETGIIFAILLGWADVGVCEEHTAASDQSEAGGSTTEDRVVSKKAQTEVATKEQEVQIRKLIEQLAFVGVPMPQGPPVPKAVPKSTAADPFGDFPSYADLSEEEVVPPEIAKENIKRARACRDAFYQLMAFKGLSIPFMAEHLDDQRPSMTFNGHWKGRGVGDACYWNIRELLEDHPADYSGYGYARTGRDGKTHVTPLWIYPGLLPKEGLKDWLTENAALSYKGKQIKCLSWYLAEENKIGASNTEDYFRDILPLEIRILERRGELGENVKPELKKLRKIQKNKEVKAIPPELLPPPVKESGK